MAEPKNTIRIENLATGYTAKGKTIIVSDNINASLRSGELTCLLGPNGAGKSTLLKTLTRFINPVAGAIYIGGRDITDYSDTELAKEIGVVLTQRLNSTNLTVHDIVAMGRSPYTGFWGSLGCEDIKIVDEAIALVGIEDLRGRPLDTLSDGERQKVMIAKALAQQTPVIILDEPTAFLDYPSKVEMMQLLQRLAREREKTVFLSTHDIELALHIADRIWLLDKRLGFAEGTPEELSLDGSVGRFFERDGIEYDPVSRLFIIHSLTD